MPTPFYHLYLADRVVRHAQLPPEAAPLRDTQRAAFLFGSTAPDVQSVSLQERAETHFFALPYVPEDTLPWEAFWEKAPSLRDTRRLSADQKAFLAGYISHIQADWLWLLEIFLPTFEQGGNWAPHRVRMVLHNVLRSYLDARMHAALPDEMGELIASVKPHNWLPFVEDSHLEAWRDLLSSQFKPGAAWQTVEVFAQRQGVPTSVYYDLLESEERMEKHVFSHIPRARIQVYDALVTDANLRLIRELYVSDGFLTDDGEKDEG